MTGMEKAGLLLMLTTILMTSPLENTAGAATIAIWIFGVALFLVGGERTK